MPRKIRRFLPVVAAAALATSGFAYMAGNDVNPSNAGMGNADISGYSVTNIAYKTDAPQTGTQHHNVTEVDFTLSTKSPSTGTAPTEVFAEVTTGTGSAAAVHQYKCSTSTSGWSTNAAGTSGSGTYTCDMTAAGSPGQLAIDTVTNLAVIAHQ